MYGITVDKAYNKMRALNEDLFTDNNRLKTYIGRYFINKDKLLKINGFQNKDNFHSRFQCSEYKGQGIWHHIGFFSESTIGHKIISEERAKEFMEQIDKETKKEVMIPPETEEYSSIHVGTVIKYAEQSNKLYIVTGHKGNNIESKELIFHGNGKMLENIVLWPSSIINEHNIVSKEEVKCYTQGTSSADVSITTPSAHTSDINGSSIVIDPEPAADLCKALRIFIPIVIKQGARFKGVIEDATRECLIEDIVELEDHNLIAESNRTHALTVLFEECRHSSISNERLTELISAKLEEPYIRLRYTEDQSDKIAYISKSELEKMIVCLV